MKIGGARFLDYEAGSGAPNAAGPPGEKAGETAGVTATDITQ